MTSDSSDSEEEKKRLREAVDADFLNDDIYNENKVKEFSETQIKSLPSLRNQITCKPTSNNPFTIKVTPEYQKHVSQHLMRILESSITFHEKLNKWKRRKCTLNGVKLLSTSKNFLLPHENNKKLDAPKKYLKNKTLSNHEIESRSREVAVSPNWILSQQETKHWSLPTKGKVEFIKMNINKNKIIKTNKNVKQPT